MTRLTFAPPFLETLARLRENDEPLAKMLIGDIGYLAEHGRGAAEPYVKHRIQASVHYPDMSEVRTRDDERADSPVLRTLVIFTEDQRIFVAVCGDKGRAGNEWYERAIPLADQLYTRWRAGQERKPS